MSFFFFVFVWYISYPTVCDIIVCTKKIKKRITKKRLIDWYKLFIGSEGMNPALYQEELKHLEQYGVFNDGQV